MEALAADVARAGTSGSGRDEAAAMHVDDSGAAAAGGSGAGPSGEARAGSGAAARSRPQQRYKANRQSVPGGGGTPGAGSSTGPKAAVGHPAGHLPPLPHGVTGLEWGLPTNPVQFGAKPIGSLLGMLAWPGAGMLPPALMGPMGLMQPPGMAPGCASPVAAACGHLASMQLGGVPGCMVPPPMLSHLAGMDSPMKRCESAPLPAHGGLVSPVPTMAYPGAVMPLCVSPAPSAPPCGLDAAAAAAMPPPSARPPTAPPALHMDAASEEAAAATAEFFVSLDASDAQPLGLFLKKTPSLADMINQVRRPRVAQRVVRDRHGAGPQGSAPMLARRVLLVVVWPGGH